MPDLPLKPRNAVVDSDSVTDVVPEPAANPVATRQRGGRRPLVLVAAGVLALLVLGVATYVFVATRAGDVAIGTTQPVTLEGKCTINWWDTERGVSWYMEAVPDGPSHAALLSLLGEPSSSLRHGTLHFDTEETATFTNEAGARISLHRNKPTRFRFADCAV